mmetsp:Transcript_22714/g.59935  ORF Transcript_22714/g.59935 Transcript_22714/m.59935 type:complete len:400 (+) Transcript_22714:73-1272(+)
MADVPYVRGKEAGGGGVSSLCRCGRCKQGDGSSQNGCEIESVCEQALSCERGELGEDCSGPVQWKHVGSGHGRYEALAGYDFVGEGFGDYIKIENVSYYGWRTRPACMLAFLLVAVVIICHACFSKSSADTVEASGGANASAAAARASAASVANATWSASASTPPSLQECSSQQPQSVVVQQRCCARFGLLCPPLPPLPRGPVPQVSPYDCQNDVGRWDSAWTPGQKAWCCQHEGKGCLGDPSMPPSTVDQQAATTPTYVVVPPWDAAAAAAAAALTAVPTAAPTPSPAAAAPTLRPAEPTTFAPLPAAPAKARPQTYFDCDEGLDTWQVGWTEAKQAWCCENTDKGCTSTTGAPPGAELPQPREGPFDCIVGINVWQNAWTVAKKTWCCAHEGKACSE